MHSPEMAMPPSPVLCCRCCDGKLKSKKPPTMEGGTLAEAAAMEVAVVVAGPAAA